ncbi:MAG: hypothetical protein OWR62_09210 [Sulfobacillus thermotolerans]|nr:hypothetical protein [Sulfobacillus thermotolerans]
MLLRTWSNAQVFLLTEFPWSVTAAWMGSYLSLFLLDQGLSAKNLGWTIGVGAFVQLLGLGLSGTLTRHVGRKMTIMSGDFAGWIVVLGIWTLSHSPWVLALGLVLNQGSGYVGPAWNSLFSEDEQVHRLPRYFLLLQVLTITGGLILPLIRGFVMKEGVVASGHTLLAIFWPSVAMAWTIRAFALRESTAGKVSMQQRQHVSWSVRLSHVRQGLQGPGFYLAVLRILVMVPLLMVAAFVPLSFVSPKGLHLVAADLSLLPIGAVGGVLILAVVRRMMPTWTPTQLMGLGLVFLALGYTGLTLGPQGQISWVLLAWGLVMAGQSQFASSHTSVWMTWLPDAVRVDVQGWIGMITAGGVAVLSPFLAEAFIRQPRWVFAGLAFLFTVCMALWGLLQKSMKTRG